METESRKLEDTYNAWTINADAEGERAALREDVDQLRETVLGLYCDLVNRWVIRTASVLNGDD